MKAIYILFLCLSIANLIQAQSAKSSLEFLKYAPDNTFSSEFESLNLSDKFSTTNTDFFKNGLFIDGIISIGMAFSQYDFNTNQAAPSSFVVYSPDLITENSFRIGSKWYFESASNFKSGIQVIWARVGLMVPLGAISFFPITYRVAPLSIGSTNFIQFTEKTGLELNLNVGLNSNIAFRGPNLGNSNSITLVQFGVLVNPSIKFRYKRLSIGLDIQYMHVLPGTIYQGDGNQFAHNYSVNMLLGGASIGYKF